MENSYNLQTSILVFEKGEDIISGIKKYCRNNNIDGGWLSGLGAVSKAEVAFYDLNRKKFIQKEIKEEMEIASLIGNVATFENDIATHIHVVLSDKNMKPLAGHLISATVAATCEIRMEVFDQPLKRKYNNHIGLNLIGG